MKKILAILLTITMCIPLVACGGGKVKAEDLAGTWSQSLWFLPTELVINDDSTYDYGEEKGTYTLSGNTVSLLRRFGVQEEIDYKYSDGYLYRTSIYAEKDLDYGRPFTPDENGWTNQQFGIDGEGDENYDLKDFDPAAQDTTLKLSLNDNGTFSITRTLWRYNSTYGGYMLDSEPLYTYEGTYKYEDSLLTLTYEDNDYPLVVEDGKIYYITYSK